LIKKTTETLAEIAQEYNNQDKGELSEDAVKRSPATTIVVWVYNIYTASPNKEPTIHITKKTSKEETKVLIFYRIPQTKDKYTKRQDLEKLYTSKSLAKELN